MTIHVLPRDAAFERFVRAQQTKSVLRFLTCGSVDDGKSTLIGRLLYDSRQVFDDHLAALRRESRRASVGSECIDFSLLVDGLSAEREQGITIDVAYRFFATERRTFIVADTPGHEQYTRNMATGASNSDLAVLLVDARAGLLQQTRRHSLIVSMLGIRSIVLAVNKMDLIGWSQSRFEAIVAAYRAFLSRDQFDEVMPIPLSALNGDNVVQPAIAAPWYAGPTLLQHLEMVEPRRQSSDTPCMPVQWVNRPHAGFRGYSGTIATGAISVGDEVRILPADRRTRIAGIVTSGAERKTAVAGQSVTLTLKDEIDVSRGDVIVAASGPPIDVGETMRAQLFWASDTAGAAGTRFYLKLSTTTVIAEIGEILHRIDPNSAKAETARSLEANDIGDVMLRLDRALPIAAYTDIPELGSFILIDRESAETVALGLVLAT